MPEDLITGIVRILTAADATVGTGFVVTDDGLIATCAHVVEAGSAGPGDTVRVAFHAAGEELAAHVEPDWWRGPDAEDIAILRLDGPVPEGVIPLSLGSSAGVEGHTLTTFGFPDAKSVEGMAGKCEVVGRTTERGFPVLQLRSSEVTPGFSGAPVLDTITHRVVGMVTAITVPDQYGRLAETTFITPTEMLAALDSALILRWPAPIESYLASVRNYCTNLPYLTLHDIQPPKALGETYVPLKAQPQPSKDQQSEVDEGHAMREARYTKPVSVTDVMRNREQPHVLILGKPGAGKSTLLRQLGESAWDAPDKTGLGAPHLPILLPLQRLATADGSLERRLSSSLASEFSLAQDLPLSFFSDWPAQTGARWLLLLDALDEVPADKRPRLVQWLNGVLKNIGQHRVVITSRSSSYTPGELDEELVRHYELLPFAPEHIREFARKWVGERAAAFEKELERVRAGGLGDTPLLLTIAAKIYLKEGTLSERRSAVYGQFVDIWLSEAEQRGLKAELGERVCKVAKFALARLALAITEQFNEVSEAMLAQVAATYLREALRLSEDEAGADGARFVQVMARRSGVFTRQGSAYSFIHPTFREYLAAVDVVREYGQNLEGIWAGAVSHWAETEWRGVVLFALSVLNDEGMNVDTLLERILEDGEDSLYFAGAALAECVDVDSELSNQIVDRLLAAARETSWWGEHRAIVTLGQLQGNQRAENGLLALARDKGVNAWARREATEALRKSGRTEQTIRACLDMARDEEMVGSKRIAAVNMLEKLNCAEDLLTLARDEMMLTEVRCTAAEAIGRLGCESEAVDILFRFARDPWANSSVRSDAARALGGLGCVDEAIEVLSILANDQRVDAQVRAEAAEAIAGLGRAEQAIVILLGLTSSETVDAWVRCRAAFKLSDLGCIEEAAEVWLVLGRDRRNGMVRLQAAKALDLFGYIEQARHILLALARDETVDERVRFEATEILRRSGYADQALAKGDDEYCK